ncbi:PREDICTED: early endosome antigen 1 [Gekko japonicus]|uniref:Early endosome antigen 1 n=1 Tax=Gekko japonicus TaxID=146911 RepID=A0ABM1KS12_GEKJA|nr:PREDICTED: early endosome antigen 1 [Gekko japonicus]
MFRRILQRTPGRVGSQSSDSESSAIPGNVDVNNEGSSEGFICPLCMKSHGSAEELFKHYEAVHDSGIDSSHGGESNISPKRDDVTLLRQEVQDLQASLKEERWYSEELKKELEKVQRQQESKPDGPSTAASTELESLQSQLEESQVENFNVKQMKDLFEQKAAQLATEIVDLKAKYDEETSLRAAAEQKVTYLTHELKKEREQCEDLKTELLQRPGVEDVAVLKKELVQVQTLMDKMTLECEKESEKLKDECKHLRAECTTSEATINQLKAELAKGPQEVAVYVQELQKCRTSITELTQKNQSLTEKLKKRELDYTQLEDKQNEESLIKKNLQATLNQKDLDCQQLQARLSASEDSLKRLQKELDERGEASQKLKEELSEAEIKYQHLKAEFKQLQQQREEKEQHGLQLQNELNQLHNKLLETERQLGEAHGRLKEQRQLSSEKLMDKEQQVADLQLKLSRSEEELKEKAANGTELQHQLDKMKQQHQEQQNLQQSTTAKLREAQNDLEQVLRQIGDKDQKIQNLEALLQKSKDNISLLEKEREDLYAKIQAGEGETAVLNQLQEKNHTLQEQVTQLTEKLRNQSESHKQAQENLHEQVQEQKAHLRASQDRALSLEATISELNSQLSESKEKVLQLDLQIKAKTELLLSAEAAKAAQRADLQNHLDTAQNALQDKQQELHKVTTQLEQATAKLHDKQEYCTQLEANLKEYKEKHLHFEQKTEELEGQHKKLEADILEVTGIKEKVLQELQEQRQQCTDLNLKAAELTKQVDAEREIVSNTRSHLQKKCDALEKANQQISKLEGESARLKLEHEKIHEDNNRQCKELDEKLQVVTEDLLKIKLEKDTLLKEFEVIRDKLSKSTESVKVAKDELEKEKQKGKVAMAELEKSCQEAKRQLQVQSESIAKEQNELKNSLEKQEGISKQLGTDLDLARAQVLQIQGVLKEKEKNEQQLQLKLKEVKESFDQKKKQIETQQAELKTALLEKAELENKLQQQITLSTQELTAERERNAELQKAHKKTQENLDKIQLDFYGKESELLAIRQDLKSTEEKLALAQEELISNRNQISNHNQLIKELKTVRATLEQDASKKEQQLKEQEKLLQEIQKEKALKEKDLANEKSKTTELQNINNKLEKENAKLKEEGRAFKQEFEKEVTNLKEAKQLLIQQKLELQGKVDNINTALEQEKRNQEVMKDQLKKREEALKKKYSELEAKLQAEIKEKDEQCKSHEESESKLNMQITALNENLSTVKKEWQSSQRRVGELEKQTDDLRGEIAVLEATVQNNQDERRVLLERCLKSEGEIEKLQSKLMDARRKLDDTTAAMQELGRENQSLQIKHTQALNRKWAEDNEVQNCMSCGKNFSVTIRRHHCRQCGNIFCAECSSKNALTPSSKKPVRVCDTCFNDLQG